jgi:hypothetical protein
MRSLKSIGETIGEYKGGVNPTEPRYRHATPSSAEYEELSTYCLQDAIVVREAVRVWSNFCESLDLGTFGMTQASQSFTAFRHRFMKEDIYLHNNAHALRMERRAYKGARTECFRIGDMSQLHGGMFYDYDVNSLYPAVMLDGIYPTRFTGVDILAMDDTPAERIAVLADALMDTETHCVIADVTLYVPPMDEWKRIVPTRHDGKLVYPTGSFRETLTTRELALAMERGVIVDVHEISHYDASNLFREYVTYFLRTTHEVQTGR